MPNFSKGLGSWVPLYASMLGSGLGSGLGSISASCGWFPVPSWSNISFNKACIKLSYYSTSVSTVSTYITLCITDTMSTVHTSIESPVHFWMSRKIWNGMLYHLSWSNPFSFVLWLDCLYRWGCWFPLCLFRSCYDDHDNNKNNKILAGLTPHEVALGVLYCKQFQLMPNQLAGVKKEDMFMVVSALFSYSTMSIWSKQVKNLILCTLI